MWQSFLCYVKKAVLVKQPLLVLVLFALAYLQKAAGVILKFTPSFYEEIKNAAEREDLAFNAYIITILMKAVK